MMMLYENFRLALFSLKANKMRSLLTMLGIIIGVSSVIAIMSAGDSISAKLSDTMEGLGANNIELYLDFRDDYDGDYYYDYSDLMDHDMVQDFADHFSDRLKAISVTSDVGAADVKDGTKEAKVSVTGGTLGSFLIDDVKLMDGRFFTIGETDTAAKVALVSSKYVDIMYDGKNKDALGQGVNVEINGKSYKFTIVGVYEYKDAFAGMGMSSGENVRTKLYIPYQTAQSITHDDYMVYFTVMAKQGVDTDQLTKDMEDFFENRYYSNNDRLHVVAYNMASIVDEATSLINTVTIGISVIAGIALLVGGIGVMNIMLVSITERTREIGTRKALGAQNSSIRIQFIIEAVVICLIGGLIGIFFGSVLGAIAAALMKTSPMPSMRAIIVSLSFSTAIGIFFGFYPANKAAKMDPIEALRYE
ncbi:MAG: ABC transporter permease [Lachnospiraceae bacterium]|nr:ABC transporter permease [Lachnospiraceae bacterium]